MLLAYLYIGIHAVNETSKSFIIISKCTIDDFALGVVDQTEVEKVQKCVLLRLMFN